MSDDCAETRELDQSPAAEGPWARPSRPTAAEEKRRELRELIDRLMAKYAPGGGGADD